MATWEFGYGSEFNGFSPACSVAIELLRDLGRCPVCEGTGAIGPNLGDALDFSVCPLCDNGYFGDPQEVADAVRKVVRVVKTNPLLLSGAALNKLATPREETP